MRAVAWMLVTATLLTALALSGCNLPITNVHPNFGPHYGDGGGNG